MYKNGILTNSEKYKYYTIVKTLSQLKFILIVYYRKHYRNCLYNSFFFINVYTLVNISLFVFAYILNLTFVTFLFYAF